MFLSRGSQIMVGGLLLILSWLPFWIDGGAASLGLHSAAPHPTLGLGHVDESEEPVQYDLADLLDEARDMLERLKQIEDYQATLVKRERVGGSLGAESRMQVKIRNPARVAGQDRGLAAYIKFLSPKLAAGREVIWVSDRFDGKLISHEGGIKNWTRMTLDPHGSLAMLGNKYPITEIGLLRLVEKLVEKGERDRNLSQAKVLVSEDHPVGTRRCRLIQVTHPEPLPGLDFHIAQIFIDQERQIPLRYAAFLWPRAPGETPPLEEEYTYLDVQLNVGLTEADFDPDNPAYEFP